MLELLLTTSINFFCLTEAVYHEARGEDRHEQIKVGVVIHNRMVYKGTSHCDIVTAPYQFSYLNGRGIGDLPMLDEDAKKEVMEVAYSIYTLDDRLYLNGIMYYHGNHMTPNWDFSKLENLEQYNGTHIFYTDAE